MALIPVLLWVQAIDVSAADALYNRGLYEQAAAQYRQLLKGLPDDPALLLRIGFCEYSLGQYGPAESTFRRVLKLAPALPQAQVGLASALIPLGRSKEAIPLLEDALKKMPGDVQARRTLGRAYSEEGLFIPAEDVLRGLVNQDPKDAESWFDLGVLLVNQNYSQPALEALDRSLALYPDNAVALTYRAGALTQLGRLEEAEAQFARLAEKPGVRESSEYFLGYAQLLFTKGAYPEALAKIENAIRSDPNSAKIRYWKARILFYMKQEDAALVEAEKCVALAPGMPGGHNLLLHLYRRKGMEEKAAAEAQWLKNHEDRVAMGRGR